MIKASLTKDLAATGFKTGCCRLVVHGNVECFRNAIWIISENMKLEKINQEDAVNWGPCVH